MTKAEAGGAYWCVVIRRTGPHPALATREGPGPGLCSTASALRWVRGWLSWRVRARTERPQTDEGDALQAPISLQRERNAQRRNLSKARTPRREQRRGAAAALSAQAERVALRCCSRSLTGADKRPSPDSLSGGPHATPCSCDSITQRGL